MIRLVGSSQELRLINESVIVTLDGEAVALAAGTAHIGAVGGHTATPRVTITRPANTTQYAVGDAWSDSDSAPTAPSFTAGRIPGGAGQITGLKVVCSANNTDKPSIQVLVFDTTFAALEDNAAVDLADAEAARLVGIFDVVPAEWVVTNAAAAASGNLVAKAQSIEPCAFACLAGAQSLYVVVRMMNAYTPVSGEALTLIFDIMQD